MSNSKDIDAILIELDYKGSYERWAMTTEEFHLGYPDLPISSIGETVTLRPMVHMYHKKVKVNGIEWKKFFSDMTYGLPESDIEAKNTASIRRDLTTAELLKYL